MKGSDRRSPVGQVGLPWVSRVLPAEGDCPSVWSSPPARGDKGQSQPVLAEGPAHMGSAEELWPQVLLSSMGLWHRDMVSNELVG